MYLQFNSKKGKNGKVYKSVLLCEKYRDGGAPKTRVIMNLSNMPGEVIDAFRISVGKTKQKLISLSNIIIRKSIDYGFVFILINLLDKLRISEVLNKCYPGNVSLIKLMIIGKIVTRGSKLCILNWIHGNKFIADKLGVNLTGLKVDDLYNELGHLSSYQNKIEQKWLLYNKSKHQNLFLYDITSSYFEGTQNDLAAFGYNRDGKKGKLQITIGLITNNTGFPLKIEVFKGNTTDSTTVKEQLLKLKQNYKAQSLTMVGDRGMRLRMNLEEMSTGEKEGIDYISALTHEEIRALLKEEVLQLSLFSKELFEISNDRFDITFDVNKYQQAASLDGKYVIETSLSKAVMEKEQVRQEYKNLQNVEHGFRDLKTEQLEVRPVFHRNEAQTRGHVFITMFSYAIVKEMETKIFPWLKAYNKSNKKQLAFADIEAELKDIKLSEIEIGENKTELKIPELNNIQFDVLKLFNIKPGELI